MTLMSTPACSRCMAVACRIVCGEIDRFAKSGKVLDAAATAIANLLDTLVRVMALPLRLGSNADCAVRFGFWRIHARTVFTVTRHNGTLRCLRPFPCRWTQAA